METIRADSQTSASTRGGDVKVETHAGKDMGRGRRRGGGRCMKTCVKVWLQGVWEEEEAEGRGRCGRKSFHIGVISDND